MFMESRGKARLIRIAVWVAILGLLFGVLSSIIMATGADAHAALRTVSPADRSTVSTPPSQVVLTFSEALSSSFATVTVTDGAGRSVSAGKAAIDGVTVTQRLAPDLVPGAYTVRFRVVSDDGHPIADITTFTLRTSATPSPTATSTPSPTAAATTPLATGSTPTAPSDSGSDDARALRLGLAVGVAALALAGGTAVVAASRHR